MLEKIVRNKENVKYCKHKKGREKLRGCNQKERERCARTYRDKYRRREGERTNEIKIIQGDKLRRP